MFCRECGYEYEGNETICKNCGVMLITNRTNENKKGNKKLIIGIAVIVIIAILAIFIGALGTSSNVIVGDWEAIGLYDGEDVKSISSFMSKGMDFSATFNSDKTFILTLQGSRVKGEWRPQESKDKVFILSVSGMDVGKAGVVELESLGEEVLVVTFPTMGDLAPVFVRR